MLAILIARAALQWITLHGPDNVTIDVNPAQIVTVREPRGQQERVVHKDVKCLLFLADGKFIAVVEDCATVRARLDDLESD